ncbi:MAG: hypothetical protein IPK97_00410 [Ahniella sp.]|nr:hypothetical protein [Ahniella sp.]
MDLAGNGPRHVLKNRLLRLGANVPDGETDSAGNTNANLDGPDEDGISTWPTYVSSGMTCSGFTTSANQYCASVSVTNTSGVAAQLVGWIDFNGDGDFIDAGERSLPRLRNTGGDIGADDTTFTTGNIPTGTSSATRVLVWTGFGVPVNASTATYGRLRLTSDATFFSDASPQPNGLAADGEVEDYLLPAGTLPVSLASVRSSLGVDGLTIEFATLAEAGNLGFEIKGASGRSVSQPIAAAEQGVNGADYEVRLPANGLTEFWIEDIALDGRRTSHGPYAVGKSYGTEVNSDTDRIDWKAIQSNLDAGLARNAKAAAPSVLLGTQTAGIHRISFADLKTSGLGLGGGVPSTNLALTDQGRAKALFVDDGNDGEFGPGDSIEFVATLTDNRYSNQNWYQLSLTGRGVAPGHLPVVRNVDSKVVPGRFVQELDRRFNLSISGAAPWVDDQILAYDRPVGLTRSFTLPAMVPLTPVSAQVTIIGGTDLAVEGPDHSVVAALNSTHRVSRRFDGVREEVLTIDVPGGLLPGQQELSLDVAADLGLPFDLVHYDRLVVNYQRYTFAVDGRFDARFEAGTGFALGGLDGAGSIWAIDADGNTYRRAFHAGAPSMIGNPAPGVELEWTAARIDRTAKPIIASAATAASAPNADFLVIAHPSLIGAAADYVALQTSRGFRVALVGTDAIYAAHSDFEASANAISAFIRAAHAQSPLKFVTLVGADSYDYRNYLGLGSVSFVPTHYVKTSAYIAQTPSDALYADVDGNEVPDLAIGRIPARTPEEMLRMTRKIRLLGERRLDEALFVAGADNSGAKRFGGLSLDFATGLPPQTRTELVQLDEYPRNDVRQAVLDGFNRGTALIAYTGHTAPGLWDFSGLLFAQDAAQMTNGGAPSLVTQWGCWNSYFVDPYAQGLSHNLLAAEGGAGTIYGATTLTEDASHTLLGQLFFEAIGAGASTLGEAELIAKRRLAELRPEARDALLGMQILGDPALPLQAQ